MHKSAPSPPFKNPYARHMEGQLGPDCERIWDFISQNKSRVFPTTFLHSRLGKPPVTKKLFGNLIEATEQFVVSNRTRSSQMTTAMSTMKSSSTSEATAGAVVSILSARDKTLLEIQHANRLDAPSGLVDL
eukprot:TRINITY_DN28798_c0_g1_i2.p1 TRINITY_DN28798_c0_g1~~TRINITY_DN28798_c0_g1_i2.p1  ORF type:complete len:131 (-),score=10.98 TRINITY_DN28798_c0_g1_i2:308-700(-)